MECYVIPRKRKILFHREERKRRWQGKGTFIEYVPCALSFQIMYWNFGTFCLRTALSDINLILINY